jgi:creatinine amidohydrolase
VSTRDLRRLDHLTWPEFRDRIGRAVVIVPFGAVEQHGFHLPLGVDAQLPFQLGLAAAGRFPAVVAPPIWFGYKSQPRSGGGGRFPGTISLDGGTLTGIARDLIADLIRQGQRSIVLLNGHMENTAFAAEGADLALRGHADDGTKVVLINWWEHVGDDVLDQLFPEGFPGWEAEHASLTETSLMAHFLPELVLFDRLAPREDYRPVPAYSVFPEPAGLVPESGVLYQAHGASADKGARLAEHITEQVVAILRREFPQFADAERSGQHPSSG